MRKGLCIFTVLIMCIGLLTGPAIARPPTTTNLQQQIDVLKAENAEQNQEIQNLRQCIVNNTLSDGRFVDNCDQTVTDRNTGLMWEKKVAGPSGSCLDNDKLHSVGATCNWFDATGAWINKLNNTCNNDPSGDCSVGGDVDCITAGVGGACGFAGYRDWRVPEVNRDGGAEELETIVDCRFGSPCIDPIFGSTAASFYWSAVTVAVNPVNSRIVPFDGSGGVNPDGNKGDDALLVRAVRADCPLC